MNFNEAVRKLQMTPSPNEAIAPIPSFNSNFNNIQPKRSFHSRSNTISDDEIAIGLKNKKHIAHAPKRHPRNNDDIIASNSNSDTYDDDIDTETEDYFSSNEDNILNTIENNNKKKSQTRGIKLFDANKTVKLQKSKSRDITLSSSKSRSRTQSETPTPTFLALPNHINESSENDNFDETLGINSVDSNLSLPKIGINKMHIRSYSESNIQKNIQKNQWPSSPSSDDSFDVASVDNKGLYTRFVSMKKKYRKQRRISRQFQDAITMIQDNNEDNMQLSEQQIKETFEKEYEIKLIELEHQKLNQTITIEDKMKDVLIQNDQLMLHNKLLQQQVAAQVAMIQEQQQMAFEQQRHFVRMHSGDLTAGNNSPSTPVLGQFPSTQAILRRVSSASTITTPMLPPNNINISAATNKNLSLNKTHSGHLGLTSHSSMGSVNTFDDANYTLNDDIHSIHTDNSMINIGDINNKNNLVNMEPNHYKYNVKKKSKRKRKKLKQIEQKLLSTDEEAQEFVGSGQTPWDRFVNLMTPSFCSCSPTVPQKSVVDQLL